MNRALEAIGAREMGSHVNAGEGGVSPRRSFPNMTIILSFQGYPEHTASAFRDILSKDSKDVSTCRGPSSHFRDRDYFVQVSP